VGYAPDNHPGSQGLTLAWVTLNTEKGPPTAFILEGELYIINRSQNPLILARARHG